ncbi:MAG: 3(2), 5-bisphosphate nucleotidase [Candidatus Sumerlaeota bacterium]|nr:3(2), 5-bisphosphate nucleotidase [Candidatus Sumerlaeota bacterium]
MTPDAPLPQLLADARTAALHAWAGIAHYYRGDFAVFDKPDGPATDADRKADLLIVEFLTQRYPRDVYGYLTEEFENDPSRLERRRVWIIDPIDGTSEFMKGQHDFAVHIGLAERTGDVSVPIVAVVYVPTAGMMFTATAGGGAFVEVERRAPGADPWWAASDPDPATADFDAPRRLAVSTSPGSPNLTAVISKSHSTRRLRATLEAMPLGRTYRRGSVGVKMAEVASANADFYLNTENGKCKEWDVCAPHLILEEAGGRVTDLRGRPITYNRSDVRTGRGILASNSTAHDYLLEELTKIPVLFE